MKAELAIVAFGLAGAVSLVGFRKLFVDRVGAGQASGLKEAMRARIRSATTAQAVCEAIASALRANAVVIECAQGNATVVAGSPWKTMLQPLDVIAAIWSFEFGQPSGSGTGNSALSDWLFIPVPVHGRVDALLAVTGRYCRRTFSLDDPVIRDGVGALSRVLDADAEAQGLLALIWN